MRRYSLAEFETQVDEVFALAESGETVILTRDGRDIVYVRPADTENDALVESGLLPVERTAIPTQADYVHASRTSYLNGLRSRRSLVRLSVFVLVIVAATSLPVLIDSGEFGYFPFIMLVVGIVAIGIGIAINLLWLPRKVSRMFRQQPAYAEPIRYRWSETGFALNSPISTLSVQWSQLSKWAETAEIFLLYLTDFQCVFVPKRMATTNDNDTLRGLLERGVSPR